MGTKYLNSALTVPVLIITLILSSTVLVNFTLAQKPNPFQSSATTNTPESFQSAATQLCTKLPISSVQASGTQSNLSPSNIVDGDPTTRWSNIGLNSWIEVDLGKQMTICNIDISWYRGNERVNDFIISGSNDGVNFVKLFSGRSTGLTSDFEKYDLKAAKAKVIRITITGNSQNNWASISEVSVHGKPNVTPSPSPSPSPQPSPVLCNKLLSVDGITEAGGQPSLSAKYAIDGNVNSRWSRLGIGSSMTLDLGKTSVICRSDISWYRGDERINNFVIAVSNNGKSFTDVFVGSSSGEVSSFEKYNFADTQARYVRITITGNSQNNWASISEVSVYGKSSVTPSPSPSPSPQPTPPPSTPGSDFNFAAVGDWSCNSRASETIAHIQNKEPELILALGDFSYKGSPDCWLEKIKDIEGITRVTIGNHDSDEEESSSLEEQYLEHFSLTQPFYSFDYKNAHFLMLSSQLDAVKGDEQYTFANNDLNKAAQNKNIDWIVVAFHKPVYTSPSKHSAETDFRNVYHPLFDKYGVDLVLQAHNHNYQRSFPISYSSQKSSSPIITDNGNSVYNDPQGVVFVIAGTGGKSLYDIKSKSSFIVNQQEEYGILDVKITNSGTKLTGTFYANAGDKIEDTFTISK